MAKLNVQELAYVRLQVPDLDIAERFYAAFGLVVRERAQDALYLRACGPEHHVLAVHKGERRLRANAFEVGDPSDLARASRIGGASSIRDLNEPGGGLCVTLNDCDGNVVELVHGIAKSEPLPIVAPDLNFAVARERRRNATVRPTRQPSRVLRLGHVVLRSPDVSRLAQWYRDNLGLLESDDVPLPDEEGLLMSFLRLNHGPGKYVDHHAMQVLHGGPREVHHISFEVQGIDDLYIGNEVLREQGFEHVWGIGRHVQGSQIFDYWRDPFGVMYEHWTDTDMLDSEVEKGVTNLGEMHSPWGPPMPEEFIRQATL